MNSVRVSTGPDGAAQHPPIALAILSSTALAG
jgi:hypothetical protein